MLLGRLIIQNKSKKLQKCSGKSGMIFSGTSARWDVIQDSSDAYMQEQLTRAISLEKGWRVPVDDKPSANQHFMLLQSRKTWCWHAEIQVQFVIYIE